MISFSHAVAVLTTIVSASALGAGSSPNELTQEQFRQRLTITAEVFIFDSTGKKLLNRMPESSVIRASLGKTSGPLTDRWASRSGLFDGLLAMKSVWEITSNNSLKVKLTEYTSDSDQPHAGENRYARELKSEERTVDLMNTVTWESVNHHNGKKVMVRYTPSLREDSPVDLGAVIVAGVDTAIVDSTGYLWADHLSFEGKYVALTTHRGTVLISYYPFKGAKELGEVRGNRIELALGDGVDLNMISKVSFMPGNVAGKVYGIHLPNRKSDKLNSNNISTSNKEEEIVKQFE